MLGRDKISQDANGWTNFRSGPSQSQRFGAARLFVFGRPASGRPSLHQFSGRPAPGEVVSPRGHWAGGGCARAVRFSEAG